MNDLITNKKAFNGAIIAILFLGAFYLLTLGLNNLKEGTYIGRDKPATNTITVTGEGEVFAKPDIATFSFSVSEDGDTVKAAQDKATAKMNSVIDAIKKNGVDEKDIKTTNYNISPKYEYYYTPQPAIYCVSGSDCNPRPIKNPKIIGYTVSESVEVKLRKLDLAGDLLSKVGSLEVSNVNGPTFSIDNQDSVKAAARAKAISSAKDKAGALASSLGVSLVRIVNFQEGGNFPVYYSMAKSADVASSAGAAPEIQAGLSDIKSNVTITYEIQ